MPIINVKRTITKDASQHKNDVIIKRDSQIQNATKTQVNKINKVVKIVDDVSKRSGNNDFVTRKNDMIHDVTTRHDGEKLTLPNKFNNSTKPIILIPINKDDVPCTVVNEIFGYLVNDSSCIHNIHNFSTYNDQELLKRDIMVISLDEYGNDFPIVSSGNIVYCKTCKNNVADLLNKSISRGNLNFYLPKGVDRSLDFVTIPPNVSITQAIQEIGDDVWVNLKHADLHDLDADSLKSAILSVTRRKNYNSVFVLPNEYQNVTLAFGDFGNQVYLSMAADGYDDKPLFIPATVDEIDDIFDHGYEHFDDDIPIQKPEAQQAKIIKHIEKPLPKKERNITNQNEEEIITENMSENEFNHVTKTSQDDIVSEMNNGEIDVTKDDNVKSFTSIDAVLARILLDKPDQDAISVVQVLENSYLSRKFMTNVVNGNDIVVSLIGPAWSKGINQLGTALLQSKFYDYGIDHLTQRVDSKLVANVLLYLKYHSIIPYETCVITDDEIIIRVE